MFKMPKLKVCIVFLHDYVSLIMGGIEFGAKKLKSLNVCVKIIWLEWATICCEQAVFIAPHQADEIF